VLHSWFDNVEAIQRTLESPENEESAGDLENFVELKYAHPMLATEQWIIGPEFR
jgi:hypothetical protein